MNRQCFRATILDAFGQIDDNAVFVVPTQSGFYRHWYAVAHPIHHSFHDVEHQIGRLQHARAGTFARYFFHRTTKIQIQYIGVRRFHHDLRGFGHCARITSVDLNGHGAFVVTNGEFLERFVDHSHQSIGGHKFGVDHRRAESSAEETETDVGHVLHGGEYHRMGTQVDIAYLHYAFLCCLEKSDPRIINPAKPRTRSIKPKST